MGLRNFIIVSAFAGMTTTATAQERQWIFDATDTDAYLVFGIPETDDIGISFWCTFGTEKIKIFVPEGGTDVKADIDANYTITIAEKPFTISGKTAVNELADGVSIEGELFIDDPLFSSLKTADRMQVAFGNHSTTFPLDSDEINNLLTVCAAK